MNKKILYIGGGILAVLLLVAGVYAQTLQTTGVFEYPNIYPEEELTACTADAMQCPDGSWVGRSGPNCEFVCPDDAPPPSEAPKPGSYSGGNTIQCPNGSWASCSGGGCTPICGPYPDTPVGPPGY